MKKAKIIVREFKNSIAGIDKREVARSQFLYQLMNLSGGGGLSGIPMSALISFMCTKATFDGNRYFEKFAQKQKYRVNHLYVAFAGGAVPRIINNAVEKVTEAAPETIIDGVRVIAENINAIATIQGGIWNENALLTVFCWQLFNHGKKIVEDMRGAPGKTL